MSLAAQLPPHVSLKQPFPVHDLAAIEAYFDRFATTLAPVSITLTHLDVRHTPLGPLDEHVILWADVKETPDLRALHERLNVELSSQFADTAAPFDGPVYHFHATVSIAMHPYGTHQAMRQAYAATRIAYTFVATHLALFYYDDDSFAPAPVSHGHAGAGARAGHALQAVDRVDGLAAPGVAPVRRPADACPAAP
jgi:2'-5' RNA ligase